MLLYMCYVLASSSESSESAESSRRQRPRARAPATSKKTVGIRAFEHAAREPMPAFEMLSLSSTDY